MCFVTLNVELSDEQMRRLEEAARRLNVTTAELAKAVINELISHRDDGFDRAAERVLKKNAELYRRLA